MAAMAAAENRNSSDAPVASERIETARQHVNLSYDFTEMFGRTCRVRANRNRSHTPRGLSMMMRFGRTCRVRANRNSVRGKISWEIQAFGRTCRVRANRNQRRSGPGPRVPSHGSDAPVASERIEMPGAQPASCNCGFGRTSRVRANRDFLLNLAVGECESFVRAHQSRQSE